MEELHPLGRDAVEVGRRHAAPLPATIGPHVAVAKIIGKDEDDIGLLDRRLRKRRTGGQPQTLCTLDDVTYADWNRDDVILLGGKRRGLMRVPAQGGAPELVTTLDPRKGELDHIGPVFLPDGRRFV